MINLKKEFDIEIEKLAGAVRDFPWENKNAYCAWMNQHYYLVQNSTRYLCYCASVVPVDDREEFNWWTHHLMEEVNHDAVLSKDAENIGYDMVVKPFAETKSLIASQYYEIEKSGQDAQLGYVLLLEGLSCQVCDEVADRVEKAHGVKAQFLRLHGSVDSDHFPNGINRIIGYSEERKKVILENLRLSSRMYELILKSAFESIDQTSRDAA